jgi:hypothetical protein
MLHEAAFRHPLHILLSLAASMSAPQLMINKRKFVRRYTHNSIENVHVVVHATRAI